jgi:hypothetical protein
MRRAPESGRPPQALGARLAARTEGHLIRHQERKPRRRVSMSIWLLILIIVLVVLAFGGFGYSRR